MRTHVVQKGDTLWKIAKQYGISFDELKRLNGHLANPDYVVPGMEIILPDHTSAGTGKGMSTGGVSRKEQLTTPITPSPEQIAPISQVRPQPVREVRPSKEEMTKPMPMPEIPPQPVQEVKPSKEKLTQPFPEYIMPTPAPQPMPQIQPEIMPEFHFAPQLHFTQPQPMPQSEKIIMTQPQPMPQPQPIIVPQPQPMPMPQPQPIMIEFPKQDIRVEVEEKEVNKTEFVPIPQPYLVYVPYVVEHMVHVPQPQPCPCKCHHKHHCHKKPRPCGCGCTQTMPMHMPEHHMSMPMFMPEQQMPMTMPIQNMGMPCGCNDSVPFNHMMMPYDSNFMQPSFFEPNYDVAPVMEDHQKDSTLPDWLVDSTNVMDLSHGQHTDDICDENMEGKNTNQSNFYHQMSNMEDDYSLMEHAYGHHGMNDHSTHHMPFQSMPENYYMQPYMNEQYNMPDYNMQHPMQYNMMQYPNMMQQPMNYQSHSNCPNQNFNSFNFNPWTY